MAKCRSARSMLWCAIGFPNSADSPNANGAGARKPQLSHFGVSAKSAADAPHLRRDRGAHYHPSHPRPGGSGGTSMLTYARRASLALCVLMLAACAASSPTEIDGIADQTRSDEASPLSPPPPPAPPPPPVAAQERGRLSA